MTKQYKHKKLGWIATQLDSGNFYSCYDNNYELRIYNKLIEDSEDWEEIKEEDIFEKINDDSGLILTPKGLSDLKESIIKHMGITNAELSEYLIMKGNMMNYDELIKLGDVIALFKKRGLYISK